MTVSCQSCTIGSLQQAYPLVLTCSIRGENHLRLICRRVTLLRSQPMALDQETILFQWTAAGVHFLEVNFDGSGRRIMGSRVQ